jgi:TPR repeat protein
MIASMRWNTLLGLLLIVGLLGFASSYAQNKAACDLLSKADAEALLGVTLLQPKPTAPFRSLLDPDFTTGTLDQGCEIANFRFNYATPNQPRPPKVIHFNLEVRYSRTPDPGAIDRTRKEVDTRTYEHPVNVEGVGDAAFAIGHGETQMLFVFVGGTTRLLVGPGDIGLEEEKALALKALAALGTPKSAYAGHSDAFSKPSLAKSGPHPAAVELLKRALTAKAEMGDARAELALGQLYEVGALAADGSAVHDYAGAAYWYHAASEHGQAAASYLLALLYGRGLGVTAKPVQAFALLQKAADGNYVPAMAPLSDLYADEKTPTSAQRATYWAMRAAEAGDPRGWLTLGFEWNAGKLGGDAPYTYHNAMQAWRKAAAGGSCVAMMEIGELFAAGHGVPVDQVAANNWSTNARDCHDGSLRSLQQQAMKLRDRAAAARDPLLSAVPAVPAVSVGVLPASAGNKAPGVSDNTKFLVGVAAVIVGAIALAALSPPQDTSTEEPASMNFDPTAAAQKSADDDCRLRGGIPGLFQCFR